MLDRILAPRSLKMAEDGPKVAQESPKMAQDGTKMTQYSHMVAEGGV